MSKQPLVKGYDEIIHQEGKCRWVRSLLPLKCQMESQVDAPVVCWQHPWTWCSSFQAKTLLHADTLVSRQPQLQQQYLIYLLRSRDHNLFIQGAHWHVNNLRCKSVGNVNRHLLTKCDLFSFSFRFVILEALWRAKLLASDNGGGVQLKKIQHAK